MEHLSTHRSRACLALTFALCFLTFACDPKSQSEPALDEVAKAAPTGAATEEESKNDLVDAEAITPRTVIYAPGLFCDEATSAGQLAAFQGSGFDTVILFSLRVSANGDLRFCNRPAVTNGVIDTGINPKLPYYLDQLRLAGATTILQSIGAGGPPTPQSYPRLQVLFGTPAGTAAITKSLQVWAEFAKVDGFDFDDESPGVAGGGTVEPQTIATLAKIVSPLGQKRIITAAPSYEPSVSFWLTAMEQIFQQNGSQLMTWMNLQGYGGAQASTWIPDMKKFAATHPIGVSDIDAFFVSGYIAPDTTPSSLCTSIGSEPVSGGMIWNAERILSSSYSLAEYSKAIGDGLNHQCGSVATSNSSH